MKRETEILFDSIRKGDLITVEVAPGKRVRGHATAINESKREAIIRLDTGRILAVRPEHLISVTYQ